MRGRKGQVWYADFMVGILIFSIVVITYFYYVEHTEYTDQNLLTTLMAESKSISGSLISGGYPLNWTISNVTVVGLTDNDYRINADKLSDFNSWSYEERRSFMRTTKDYYFYFEYLNGTRFNELCADPAESCVEWNESSHLVQTTRLVIYYGDIVKMKLYIYQAS